MELLYPPTGMVSKWKSESSYDRRSAGQSVLVIGNPSGARDQFFHSLPLKLSSGICGFLIMQRPLWREAGSQFTGTSATGPCQRCHSRAQTQQNLRPYLTVSFEAFSFCSLLRLASLRWKYSNPPLYDWCINRPNRPNRGHRFVYCCVHSLPWKCLLSVHFLRIYVTTQTMSKFKKPCISDMNIYSGNAIFCLQTILFSIFADIKPKLCFETRKYCASYLHTYYLQRFNWL
jgi:hypothetical protein